MRRNPGFGISVRRWGNPGFGISARRHGHGLRERERRLGVAAGDVIGDVHAHFLIAPAQLSLARLLLVELAHDASLAGVRVALLRDFLRARFLGHARLKRAARTMK